MSTLRKPIKITVLGSDGKDYSFLIKFGEDLRQDQRIQQLFLLMNTILTDSQIKTYQIIPLTHNLGMIEWVDETVPLLQFGFKTQEGNIALQRACEVYKTHLFKAITPNHDQISEGMLYMLASQHYDKNTTVAKFEELTNMLPNGLFR